MAVNTQFAIAVHVMAALGYRPGRKLPSADLAASVNTSASFVRRILARLSKAGLIETATGKSGCCWLARNPGSVSLLDIYRAVEAPRAFAIHKYPANKPCPVSCEIKGALNRVLDEAQKSLERSLGRMSLARVIAGMRRK